MKNEQDYYLFSLEHKIKNLKIKITQNAAYLIGELNYVAKEMDRPDCGLFNSCGVLQATGVEFEKDLGKLRLLLDLKNDYINSQKEEK